MKILKMKTIKKKMMMKESEMMMGKGAKKKAKK